MDQIISWKTSLNTLSDTFLRFLPTLLGAIALLFFGWLAARFFSFIISKILKATHFDRLITIKPFSEYYDKNDIKVLPSEMTKKIVYWVIILIAIVMAAETLGLRIISQEISNLINYLPRLFSAIVLFIIGVYFTTFIRDFIKGTTSSLGIAAGKIVSSVVFYLLFILVSLTCLKQAGVDTAIITSNLTLIIGSVLLAFSISYGFASREILSNILASYFSRRSFQVGQRIEFDHIQGEILEINSISIKLKTNEGELVIPTHKIISNMVKIIK